MPILIDSKGIQYTSQDPQQIYNALKSGNYQLMPESELYLRDSENATWKLNSQQGDINQQLLAMFEHGGRFETKDEAFERMYPELTGVTGDVLAGVTSAANAALFGLPAAAIADTETGALFNSLRNTHPISSMIGDVAGVISKATPAGAVASAAGKALGAGAAGIGAGRIATMAAEGAGIGAASSIPLAVTEQALGNPISAAENFIGTVGGGALIGGIASPILGVAVPKAAELFGKGTKATTALTNRGIGAITTKLDDSMTAEQKTLFDNLTKDPESRKAALALTKDVEEVTIKATVDDLTSLSKIIKEDVKNLYDTKFERIVKDLPKEQVLAAKQEMLDVLKNAKATMIKNPESYDSSFLNAIKAAEKTLDVRGAGNVKTRELMEEALKKLKPEQYSDIEKGFDIAKAKAIKEARTEIRAGTPDRAKAGLDRTGMLSREMNEKMTEISRRLYGDEFIQISDTYASTKDVLDNIKKLAFNSDGTVNYNKVKSMISNNTASELKLDELLSKVEKLSGVSGKEYNFGSQLDDTLKSIRTKQTLKSLGGNTILKTEDVFQAGALEAGALAVGIPPGVTTAALGTYKTLKNPRSALALMNFLEGNQVRAANAVNKIANTFASKKTQLTKTYLVGGQSFDTTKQEIIKDIKTYKMYQNPAVIEDGYNKTFGIMGKVAPNVSAHIKSKTMDIAQFLASKAPKYSENPITGEIKLMSTQQKINEYQIYKAAVNEPLKALEQINSGVNVSLNREALQAIYPYMWNQYVQMKLESVQGQNLSIDEQRSLNFTLGLENQDFTLPSIINNAINPIEANQAQQPNKPVSSPSANTGETSRIQRP